MASTSALTGGTKDVNPQVMSATLRSGTNANESYSVEVPLPVQRLNNRNRSMVMEVLSWQIYSNNTGAHHVRVGFSTSKPSPQAGVVPLLSDPSIVAMTVVKGTQFDLTPTVTYPLDDGAGHGLLVAADKIWFFCNSPSNAAHDYELRLTYRWKNVSLTEYIGIVQASQA